jgi:hypothetical protein
MHSIIVDDGASWTPDPQLIINCGSAEISALPAPFPGERPIGYCVLAVAWAPCTSSPRAQASVTPPPDSIRSGSGRSSAPAADRQGAAPRQLPGMSRPSAADLTVQALDLHERPLCAVTPIAGLTLPLGVVSKPTP